MLKKFSLLIYLPVHEPISFVQLLQLVGCTLDQEKRKEVEYQIQPFIPNPAICVSLIISSSAKIDVCNRLDSPGKKFDWQLSRYWIYTNYGTLFLPQSNPPHSFQLFPVVYSTIYFVATLYCFFCIPVTFCY